MTRTLAAVGAALAVGTVGVVAGSQLVGSSSPAAVSTTVANCEDWGPLPASSCFAGGIIRNVSLHNLQGAVQFCKWRDANPGEWSRLKGYASTGTTPTSIITWMGSHIQNDLQAYFAAGGPVFTIAPNTAPNACTGKLLAPPVVSGVTPGQTSATVTIQTTP